MAIYEKGICIFCEKCRDDCLASNLGSICHDCWQSLLKKEINPGGVRVGVPPEPDKFGYAIMEKKNIYITIGGTLYLFAHEEHAKDLADKVRISEPGSDVVVERVWAQAAYSYVMQHSELKLLYVEDVKEKT